MKQPTKAIICAAGLGTRFLPQTKAMPKEMLPIIDKPVIQLVVEEAVAAGVTEIIIVTGYTKRSIEDHFDRSDELETELREKGKDKIADRIKEIAELANFVYVRQKGYPKGNARPVLNSQHLIDDDEPFFVFSADDFFSGKVPRAVQMKEAYNKTGKSVICLQEINPSDADKYGMAKIGDDLGNGTFEVDELVEKPGEANRPSNYASFLGYLLTPDIFPILSKEKVDKKGEITMSENINVLARQGKVCGQVIDGVYHDTGDPVKYIQTVVDMALDSPEYGKAFSDFLKKRIC
ncbi:MAG TPA: UTP--glucose-1-phosphate uridylyltransferase [Candidatus Saccharibacteria bacterium]|nr:UTP--glucose-1-phosphate uridylyltransferase [Candidatus Saccharibacteria bacterium]